MGRVKANVQFPFINLEKAIGRAKQLYDADQRGNEMSIQAAFAVWEYSEKSSGGFQTVSALKMYGILEESGRGKVKLTKHAMDYFRDEREDHKAQRLQDFATNPLLLMELFNQWGSHVPSDTVARTYLKLDRGLNEQSSRALLGIYKENIAFANIKGGAKSKEIVDRKGVGDQSLKVGDYVQWTSNGVDQFKPVRKITKIEGDFALVHGSLTGIPMAELTQAEAPKATLSAAAGVKSEGSGESSPDISVLLVGNRLQITADVDDKGLEKLENVLVKYKEILKMLQAAN